MLGLRYLVDDMSLPSGVVAAEAPAARAVVFVVMLWLLVVVVVAAVAVAVAVALIDGRFGNAQVNGCGYSKTR